MSYETIDPEMEYIEDEQIGYDDVVDDDDDDDSDDSYAEGVDPEFSFGSALGALATGGLSLVAPAAIKTLGIGRRPKTGRGRGYSSRIKGRRGGTIRTPTGSANFNFPTTMATKQEVQRALGKVGSDVRKNASAIRSTHKKIDAITKTIATDLKKVDGKIDKMQQNSQMQSMMSMFMQPELDKIKLKGAPPNANNPTEYEVSDTDYESNMLPMIMGMMGGGTSGSDDNQMMMMMMMMMMDD